MRPTTYITRTVAMLFLVILASCGYEKENIKNYRINVSSEDPTIISAAKALINKYNLDAGRIILSYESNPAAANSFISVHELIDRGGHEIGFGQWINRKKQKIDIVTSDLYPLKERIEWGILLEFDETYFTDRMNENEDSPRWMALYTLFCHEVGHGLMLDDTYNKDQRSSVMFGIIDEKDLAIKDFDSYFEYVRGFVP
jgi:hypothetical protein